MTDGRPSQPDRVPRQRRGRDRRHAFPGRPRAVNAKFTDAEYAELATAAHHAGLTPTGFCALAAIDAARGHQTYTPAEQAQLQALAHLQTELLRTRTTINQMRAELGRAIDANADDPETLDSAIQDAATSLHRIDDVISHIHQRLAQRRPPTGEQQATLHLPPAS
jgi:septal ring factor EnvC (AmiA/AmiB activator)